MDIQTAIKPEHAVSFYSALTGMQNPPLTIQWFCDYDKERRDLAGWEYSYIDTAKLLDLQHRGCGVFTCVNGSTTGGRSASDMDIFRAVFMDSDGAAMPSSWPVTPHAIVKRDDTHFHAYWFIDGDCSPLEWMIAQKQIALHFGSDESMVNPDRVMRIPGFVHQKSLDNKVVYALDTLNADLPRYKLRDILSHFTLTDEKMTKMGEWVQGKSKGATVTGIEDFDDNANNCDQFIKYLHERAEQSVSGQGGNHVLFTTAAQGRDYGLSPTKVFELMLAHWDDRNSPPWGDEMLPTINNVYKYGQNGVGAKSYSARIAEPAAVLPGMSLTPVENTVYVPENVGAPKAEALSRAEKPEYTAAEVENMLNTDIDVRTDIYINSLSKSGPDNARVMKPYISRFGERFTMMDEMYEYNADRGVYAVVKGTNSIDPLRAVVAEELSGVKGLVSSTIDSITKELRAPMAVSNVEFPHFISNEGRVIEGCASSVINFRNGLLDLNAMSEGLKPHNRTYRSLHQMDFDYDPSATCPNWLKFLGNIWEGEYAHQIEVLQLMFGYMMLDMKTVKAIPKCGLLYGASRAGKGLIQEVARKMAGPLAVEADMNILDDDNRMKPAITAPVVTVAEAGGYVINSSRADSFKKLVERVEHSLVCKYSGAVNYTPSCFLMMAANSIPTIDDRNGAVSNRIIALKFVKSFAGRENTTLPGLLEGEAAGIKNWQIEGYKKVLKLIEEDSLSKVLHQGDHAFVNDDFLNGINPLKHFVKNNFVESNHSGEDALATDVLESLEGVKRLLGLDKHSDKTLIGKVCEVLNTTTEISSVDGRYYLKGYKRRVYSGNIAAPAPTN